MENTGHVLLKLQTRGEGVQCKEHHRALGTTHGERYPCVYKGSSDAEWSWGNENMPRPKHYRAFNEVDKLVRLIAAMTCVENGIKWEDVDRDAIWEGYKLAFRHSVPQDDKNMDDEVQKIGPHWDEYWDWSPQAYGK